MEFFRGCHLSSVVLYSISSIKLFSSTTKAWVLFSRWNSYKQFTYMDDINLFAKSGNSLNLSSILLTLSQLPMECSLAFKNVWRGKWVSSGGVILPDGLIATLTPLKYYKYLGIYEADSINCPKTKETVQTEYLCRLRKILSSQLHGSHKSWLLMSLLFLFCGILPQ